MAASAQDKAIVLNMLQKKNTDITAVQTAVNGAVSSLSGSSTEAALQAAVDAYNALRGAGKIGNITLPALDASEALDAVKAAAV
jgi:hypothetical protein